MLKYGLAHPLENVLCSVIVFFFGPFLRFVYFRLAYYLELCVVVLSKDSNM